MNEFWWWFETKTRLSTGQIGLYFTLLQTQSICHQSFCMQHSLINTDGMIDRLREATKASHRNELKNLPNFSAWPMNVWYEMKRSEFHDFHTQMQCTCTHLIISIRVFITAIFAAILWAILQFDLLLAIHNTGFASRFLPRIIVFHKAGNCFVGQLKKKMTFLARLISGWMHHVWSYHLANAMETFSVK